MSRMRVAIFTTILFFSQAKLALPQTRPAIWISAAELAQLPASGPAWDKLKSAADSDFGTAQGGLNDNHDVYTFGQALVAARLNDDAYRAKVADNVMSAIGTENNGNALCLARNLLGYVLAADLIDFPNFDPAREAQFRDWLSTVRHKDVDGMSLIFTHEDRPNNWGTHAGASRIAAAIYLGDQADLERAITVFKGWLGDRATYSGFKYGDLHWQADPDNPVGINPKGSMKEGHSIDGVLPDDQRRAGGFRWPPPKENYVHEALQGVTVQAEMLRRLGYDAWNWQDQALLRAIKWSYEQASFPPTGDDTFMLPLFDRAYGTTYWNGSPVNHGKAMGWTDWTHAKAAPTGVHDRNENSPDEIFLVTCYPNPFNAQATFEYSLPATGAVRLYIYNALGQEVRKLIDQSQPAGHRRALWDATDDHGLRISSGTYFYQFEVGRQRLAGRLILQQ